MTHQPVATTFPLAAAVDPAVVRELVRFIETSVEVGTQGGTADAQTPTWSPALTEYPNFLAFRSAGSNTVTAPTVNPSSLGALTLKRSDGTALAVGDTGIAGTLLYGAKVGSNLYLLNPQTISGANINVQRAETGAVVESVSNRFKRVLRLTDFGAAPDGFTDSTTAIVNAINAAAANNVQEIICPAGTGPYVTDTVTIGNTATKGIKFKGESPNHRGLFYPSAAFMLKPTVTGVKDLFTIAAAGASADSVDYVEFEDLNFYTNNAQAGLTGGYLINCPNETLGIYPLGVIMRRCSLQGGKSGGIYIGNKRQSELDEVRLNVCGATSSDAALTIDTYDVALSKVYVNSSPGVGIRIVSGDQLSFFYVAVYLCDTGVTIANAVAGLKWHQGSIDHNSKWGIISNRNTSATYKAANRVFDSIKFLKNSHTGNALYTDVLINDADLTTVFNQCSFDGDESDAAHQMLSPFGFGNASARVRANNCTYNLARYSTAARTSGVTGHASCLVDTGGVNA